MSNQPDNTPNPQPDADDEPVTVLVTVTRAMLQTIEDCLENDPDVWDVYGGKIANALTAVVRAAEAEPDALLAFGERCAWAMRSEMQNSMRHTINSISEQVRISQNAPEYRMAHAASVDCYRAASSPDPTAIVRRVIAARRVLAADAESKP